ncbi:MAG TPA: hypothetical protein VJR29_09125 [bacterium]|nr:hypothetical protein [bacterium]
MSDLRIYVSAAADAPNLHTATAACSEAPPENGRSDSCRVSAALTLAGSRPPAPRTIHFDRRGDRFVLSPQNNAENLTWVSSNQNLSGVLAAIRVTGALARGFGRSLNPDTATYFLWLSRYIVSGEYRHDGLTGPVADIEMNEMLIDLFSGSSGRGMVNLIGSLNLLRREDWLSEEARNRIRSITAILDLVPTYDAVVRQFFSREFIESSHIDEAQFANVARIYQFIRRLAVNLREGRPPRFDSIALAAARAYAEFYRREIASGARPEFCGALEAALRQVGGATAPGSAFLGECRRALAWAEVPAEQALRESARLTLTDEAGMQQLQQAIAEESRRANMRLDWLSRRGAYGQVLEALLRRISLVPAADGAPARLRFDIANFSADLRRLTILTDRGEYDLSALAFLRRIFGREGNPSGLRVFSEGVLGELAWDLSAQDLSRIRALQAGLQGRRRSNADFSRYGMPAILGTSCAVGVGGLILSQTLPALRSNAGAQLAVGLPSAGLAGGGCLGLAGHYFWPAVAPRAVHNRNAWDLGTSGVGSALGIGTYLLIHAINGGRPLEPGQRNPVDPFGP